MLSPRVGRRHKVLALLCLLTCTTPASAAIVHWDGSEDDNWNKGLNWDKLICVGVICAWVPPGQDDTAVLSNTSFGTWSQLSNDAHVNALLIRNGFTVFTDGFQLISGDDATSSSSRIEINGPNSRLRVEGAGGPDADLITNRFEIFGAGGMLQLDDDVQAVITSASGESTLAPLSTIRGSGTLSFTNTPGGSQTVFENAGTIDVFRGDLTLRAENGGRLDLDGTFGDDGILDIDDGEIFGISGNRTLRIEGPVPGGFDGILRIGRGDAIEFASPWFLGALDQLNDPGSATVTIDGRAGTAYFRGAPVTVRGGDTRIDITSGTARFDPEVTVNDGAFTMSDDTRLEFQSDVTMHQGSIAMGEDTILQFAGDMAWTQGEFTVGDGGRVEFLGNTDIGKNVVINTGIFVFYDLFVEANTTIRSTTFDWDAGPLVHNTTVQGGALRILSDTIDDDNDFGGDVHLISEPGSPAILEVSTTSPWTMSGEMLLDSTADIARVEGTTMSVGKGNSDTAFTFITVAGTQAEILPLVAVKSDAQVMVPQGASLRFANHLFAQPGSEFVGGGTVRSEGVSLVADTTTLDVHFVNAGTLNPTGDGLATAVVTMQSFEQTASGELNLELDGLTPGGGHDQLIVTDDATLAGMLTINLLGGFTPVPGNTFTILETVTGNVAGAFDTISAPTFSGLTLKAVYNAKSVVLQVGATIAGDYNNSGQVEQGDLDLVLQNWGLDTNLAGIPAGWVNDLPSGQIEQTELDGILQNWGSTSAPTFGSNSVPEPVSALALGVLLTIRRCDASPCRGFAC